jgi:hypothetical protein
MYFSSISQPTSTGCLRCVCYRTCLVDAIEFSFICFWMRLRQILVRQKYHSSKSIYKLSSLARSFQIASFSNISCFVLSTSEENCTELKVPYLMFL